MGINRDKESRLHRLCCPEDHPITIALNPWRNMGFSSRLRYDRNGRGDFYIDIWPLQIRIRPRDFIPEADRKRYEPLWDARWQEVLREEEETGFPISTKQSIIQDLKDIYREFILWWHRKEIDPEFKWFAEKALTRIPQYIRPRCWILGHRWEKWVERHWFKKGAFKCGRCGFTVILPLAWDNMEDSE